MYNQNLQDPLNLDWLGVSGPSLTDDDVYNSLFGRMIRGSYDPSSQQTEYVRRKPWWNLRDPFAQKSSAEYIPGKQKIPQYPRLSTLTQEQHLLGLKVLSLKYGCQPCSFPTPAEEDFGAFEKIKDIYEKEQKEYVVWARNLWVNGDCVRPLQLKPLLETVYEAQFELKKKEIHTLPHEFEMAAQISLEPRTDAFEFQHIKNLKSVDVNSLPKIMYPDVLEVDVSILREYEVPVPCHQHPTRFILPHENTVTTLPLPEVNKQLAHFAMENDALCIASEKALQCLLEPEQSWKLPVSVVEIECPEGGGVKTVVVLGSRFDLQKECAAQRSFQAYQHLLRCSFLTPTETTGSSSSAHQASTSNQSKQFDDKQAALNSIKDEEELQTEPIERRQSAESATVSCVPLEPGETSRCVADPCRPLMDDNQNNSSIKTADDIEQPKMKAESGSSEPDGLVIDNQKPEVSGLVQRGKYKTQAELSRKQNFALYFGPDSEEEQAFEKKLQAIIEVSDPDDERKQTNIAGICTDIEKAQTSDQSSFDTTLPTKASPNIIGKNPTSGEDIDEIICACEGTVFEVPPPRSFQKWQVKNAVTNGSFDLIIHSSHKAQHEGPTNVEAILEPIVEWQPELGACKLSAGRVQALSLAFMMRPKAVLLNVRIDYKNGNIIVIDRAYEQKFTKWHGDKKSEIADKIHGAIEQLRSLKPGQYILAHDRGHGAHAMVYSALAEPTGAGFTGHTLSLRPETENLTEAEETALTKTPPEISRAMLPYHKKQIILPRAFTTDKNHVQKSPGCKKVSPGLAPAPTPPEAKKRRKKDKKRKGKKRRTERPEK